MHKMYSEWCAEYGHEVENYNFYARVFREKFNLKFQKPKKDTCDKCETFSNTPITGRRNEGYSHETHPRKRSGKRLKGNSKVEC